MMNQNQAPYMESKLVQNAQLNLFSEVLVYERNAKGQTNLFWNSIRRPYLGGPISDPKVFLIILK